jgi:hypothetical protein
MTGKKYHFSSEGRLQTGKSASEEEIRMNQD